MTLKEEVLSQKVVSTIYLKDNRKVREVIGNLVDEDIHYFPIRKNKVYVRVDDLSELSSQEQGLVDRCVMEEMKHAIKVMNRAKKRLRFLSDEKMKIISGELIK